MDSTSKTGPKQTLFDTKNCVFSEVDSSMISPVWKYFLRDKKHGLAKCKECDCVLKAGQSTSPLINYLKAHKIELKTVENTEEPPCKKVLSTLNLF